MSESDIIEIPDDEPKGPVRVTIPAKPDAPVAVVDAAAAATPAPAEGDAIASLKKQVEDANARTEAERRERVRLENENRSVRTDAQNLNMVALSTQIDNTDRVLKEAKSEYAQLLAAGEYEKAADAQEKIATAAYDKRVLEAQKSDAELQIQRPTTEGRVQPLVREPSSTDALEAFAGKLPAKSAQWLREHPDAYHKQANKLSAAHMAAVDLEGITPETPEYFAYIEKRLGIGEGDVTRADPGARDPDARSAQVTAPVSRQAPNLSGRRPAGPRTVDLTPEMQRMAADLDMTPQEYAEHRLALEDEGKLVRH